MVAKQFLRDGVSDLHKVVVTTSLVNLQPRLQASYAILNINFPAFFRPFPIFSIVGTSLYRLYF